MNRESAIGTIMKYVNAKSDIVISTTGLISREIYEKYDYDGCFYVPGSMGLVSSIGLGVALCSNRNVIVIDGDASLLMNFGTLVTNGKWQVMNLVHVVLDNQAFGSCSEEASLSRTANFVRVAEAVGYMSTFEVYSEEQLGKILCGKNLNPSFIHAKIELGGRRDFARPLDLPSIKNRFMNFVKEELL